MDKKKLCLIILALRMRRKKSPRYWVHPLVQMRKTLGQFYTLHNRLLNHPEKFFSYYRMSIASFNELLEKVGPRLQRRERVRESFLFQYFVSVEMIHSISPIRINQS